MRRASAACQAFFPGGASPLCELASQSAALECRRAKSVPVTKSGSLNHLIVADQRAMGLFTGVLAKAITRVYLKLDQPPVNVLAIFTQIGWLRIALPLNFRAVGIEQHSLEPIPDNFLIVFRIRSAKSRIKILREEVDGKKANQEEADLHNLRKSKIKEIVDKKVALL